MDFLQVCSRNTAGILGGRQELPPPLRPQPCRGLPQSAESTPGLGGCEVETSSADHAHTPLDGGLLAVLLQNPYCQMNPGL